MPYFVYAAIPATMGQHTPHAYVTGNITAAVYQQTYGNSPANAGIPGQTDAGFPSKALAQTAADAFNKHPGPSLGGVTDPSLFPKISNPLSGIDEIGAVLKAFFQQITRVELWRSLGWIVLGIVLMGLGAYLWLHKEGLVPDAIPIPV